VGVCFSLGLFFPLQLVQFAVYAVVVDFHLLC